MLFMPPATQLFWAYSMRNSSAMSVLFTEHNATGLRTLPCRFGDLRASIPGARSYQSCTGRAGHVTFPFWDMWAPRASTLNSMTSFRAMNAPFTEQIGLDPT